MKENQRLPVCTAALTMILLVGGCGRPFSVQTPERFVELEEARRSDYTYRATSSDGVVVAVRVVDNDVRGRLTFWLEAIRNKLRDSRGYELLEELDVPARQGNVGKQLRFGRDEGGHPYTYWVTIFARSEGRRPLLWIVEAGGESEVFTQRQSDVEAVIASFEPR